MTCHTIWPIFYFFKIILFIYLFLSMLGLHYCEGVFSSGGKQGLLWLRCASLSLQGFFLWWNRGSRACGLLQLKRVASVVWLSGSRAQVQLL